MSRMEKGRERFAMKQEHANMALAAVWEVGE